MRVVNQRRWFVELLTNFWILQIGNGSVTFVESATSHPKCCISTRVMIVENGRNLVASFLTVAIKVNGSMMLRGMKFSISWTKILFFFNLVIVVQMIILCISVLFILEDVVYECLLLYLLIAPIHYLAKE